jgi:tetratricopeptide (TPR) repeat protein
VSGLAEELAFDSLDVALAAGVVEEREAGYRFRHVLIRDALEESLPAHRRRVAHRKAAECLAEGRAQPVRVAHHLLRAGDEREAVPWLEEAARRALALGALADASRVAEDALAFADEARRPAILELRGDILFARGAPEAATAYGDALAQVRGSTRRRLRIKQARAYLAAGAVDAASEAVAGPEASTADERLALLLARGYLAWARNEVDEAERAATDARTLALDRRSVADVLQATQLLGLAALSRGAWRDFVRAEVVSTAGQAAELVDAIFDAHLCLAEFLLHGGEPYEEVARFARSLRSLAGEMRSPRAEAFAVCMLGEAELHAGRLEEAEGHLSAAVELHRRAGAATGEALSLQRLAEASLGRGHDARAALFLRDALASAQTSAWRSHLLPRVYATILQMELERPKALALLDEAELELEQSTPCQACAIGFFTAAAAVTARGGDLERSRRYLEQAETVAAMWEGGMWAAAVREAGAVLRLAAGEAARARRLFTEAARIFEGAGQPRDADRCRTAATRIRPVSVSR